MKFKVKKVDRSEGLKEALYIPGIAVGLKHTMRHFFRNIVGKKDVVTIQYPDCLLYTSPSPRDDL